MTISPAAFAQADDGAPMPHAAQWLADIGFPHDADVAARMADVVLDGLNAVGSGEPAYALKVATLTKALAALIAAVPDGDEAQEIVDGMCEAVGGAIGMEARKLRRALAKDQRAHLKASRGAFGRPADGR